MLDLLSKIMRSVTGIPQLKNVKLLYRQPDAFWLIDSMREMMGLAPQHLGKEIKNTNPWDLKVAADLLVVTKQSKNCMGFKSGFPRTWKAQTASWAKLRCAPNLTEAARRDMPVQLAGRC
jgi:hypothetical protein